MVKSGRCNGELWWQQQSLNCLHCGWLLRQASISGVHYTCSWISRSLGPDKSQALAIFHAYTRCDTVSSFYTRSKKVAWGTWKAFDGATATWSVYWTSWSEWWPIGFSGMIHHTAVWSHFKCREHKWSMSKAVHKKGLGHGAILPTRVAFVQHIKRAVYRGGHCYARCWKAPCVCLQLKTEDGVTHRTGRQYGTLLPEASTAAWELNCRGCKQDRGLRGKKAQLKCTALRCVEQHMCGTWRLIIRSSALIFIFPVVVEVC